MAKTPRKTKAEAPEPTLTKTPRRKKTQRPTVNPPQLSGSAKEIKEIIDNSPSPSISPQEEAKARRAVRLAARIAAKQAASLTPKTKTPTKSRALASPPPFDKETRSYLDAHFSKIQQDHYANIEILQAKIKELRSQLIDTQTLLTSFIEQKSQAPKAAQPDDKYILTKAKLIKLMKDLGYY